MQDYSYPSVFLAYLMFFVFLVGGIFFAWRSRRDGYWGEHSEDVKYQIFNDEDTNHGR